METLLLIAVALFAGLLMTRLFVKFHLPDRLEDDPDIWRFVTDVQNETHRFAIEYNRKLTEKRYKKSPLDGIKGVGDKRKVTLLRKFGSVKGIREASAEDIASAAKISPALAEKIKEELSKTNKESKAVRGGDSG